MHRADAPFVGDMLERMGNLYGCPVGSPPDFTRDEGPERGRADLR